MRISFSLCVCLLVLNSVASAQDSTVTPFDVPGAVWTLPVSINDSGTIAGSYSDDISIRCFLRDRNGNFTTFDVPQQLLVYRQSLNLAGSITGNYYGGSAPNSHGFLRSSNGTFSTFDVQVAKQGTFPTSINQTGAIAGYYVDNGAWIVQQPPWMMGEHHVYGLWKVLEYDRTDAEYSRELQVRGLGLQAR